LERILSRGRDYAFLAILREGLGDRRGSLEYLHRATADYQATSSPSFLARAGVMYVRAGDLTRAQRALDTALRQFAASNQSVSYHARLLEGELLLARGDHDRAIALLSKTDAELVGQPLETGASLGHAYDRAGRDEMVMRTYEAIADQNAAGWEFQHAWFSQQYRLAELYAQRGERGQAAARLDRMLELWRNGDPSLPLLVAAKKLRDAL
jgi:tetratricopeptide (TPR) repeat protein